MGSLCFKIGSVEGWNVGGGMKRGMERMCLRFQIVTGLNGSSDVPVSCRDLTNGCVCERRKRTIQKNNRCEITLMDFRQVEYYNAGPHI